jgi:hypothetical protein
MRWENDPVVHSVLARIMPPHLPSDAVGCYFAGILLRCGTRLRVVSRSGGERP